MTLFTGCECCSFGPRNEARVGRRRVSRRQFIASIAAAGSVALFPAAARSQIGTTAQPPQRIDVHYHVMPPAWVNDETIKAVWSKTFMTAPFTDWSPGRAIDAMDRGGIATGMCSPANPGVWFGGAAQARRLAREWSEYTVRLGRDHPGRFGLFAPLPLPDIEGSLSEIEYAFDVLKADGISLFTSYGNRWPGDAEFDPVFAELNRRKALVFVHPSLPVCCTDGLMSNVPSVWIEYPTDTTRVITNLIITGTLYKYPDIRFIFSHAGGTMMMLAGRIEGLMRAQKVGTDRIPAGIGAELGKLYYDTAGAAQPATMAALTKLVPISHILFGSDYPFVPVAATAEGLGRVGLADADRYAIERGNALDLLPGRKI